VDQQTFDVSGGAAVGANCGILDESSNPDGLNVSGGSTVNVAAISLVATSYTGVGGGSTVNPTPVTGVAPVTDPFANLAAPSPCASSGGCPGGAACNFTNFHPGSSTITTAGVYCGGIQVSGGNTLTLGPGTYILEGGGIQVNGGNLIGTGGVTFYNTYPAGNPGQYKNIAINGGSSTDLVAPTSGTYKGILFFQDRSAALPASTSNNQESVTGGSSAIFTGALYFPNSPLVFSGGSEVTPESATLFAYTITLSGNTVLNVGSVSSQTTPITTTRLYE